jgi:hypothetical protein
VYVIKSKMHKLFQFRLTRSCLYFSCFKLILTKRLTAFISVTLCVQTVLVTFVVTQIAKPFLVKYGRLARMSEVPLRIKRKPLIYVNQIYFMNSTTHFHRLKIIKPYSRIVLCDTKHGPYILEVYKFKINMYNCDQTAIGLPPVVCSIPHS